MRTSKKRKLKIIQGCRGIEREMNIKSYEIFKALEKSCEI